MKLAGSVAGRAGMSDAKRGLCRFAQANGHGELKLDRENEETQFHYET